MTEDAVDTEESSTSQEPSGVPFLVVGVGASAGGLEAFTQLLAALPSDTGMAFVLVQHLAPTHPSALAEILARATSMPVREVQGEPKIEPNHVYVIPPAQSIVMHQGALQLSVREAGLHRPVDAFFQSLADAQRHRAIGVVLSGSATDGTIGVEAIKAAGGITFAQDATAQHQGMPTSAAATGSVDFVLPPAQIALELVRISLHPLLEQTATDSSEDSYYAKIVELLLHAKAVDFSHYKFKTFYRRVTRRMMLQKVDRLSDYLKLLRSKPAELEALYQDILIGVTSFFRNPEAFEALKETVFPRLCEGRTRNEPLRFWTLGCSTGQEAYSLAIAYAEYVESTGSVVPLQLFASDLNAACIDKARASVYPRDIASDLSPLRLKKYFTEVEGGYRVAKSIRDVCIFSRQNVLVDPPFSRMDLVSCRNLMIYMEPIIQKKVIQTAHYALRSGGCLWLGASESLGASRHLFETVDIKNKIYCGKPGPSSGFGQITLPWDGPARVPFSTFSANPNVTVDLPREADRVLLLKYAPPGVLVSADLEILQYRGNTGPYLAPTPGKASLNLIKMLREGLLVAVRSALKRASELQQPVREEGLRVKTAELVKDVAIEVIPLKESAPGAKDGGFLVLFEEELTSPGRQLTQQFASAQDEDVGRLTQELAATREYLHSVIEEQDAANEELQSANEEVQSANEELQSTNEELETSKEEIQSSNEELATLNDELNNRNAEVNQSNDDLVNLLQSVQIAIIMLGPDLRIRRFTPAAAMMLNLISGDLGRPFLDIKLNLEGLPDPEFLLRKVFDTGNAVELDVRDRLGRWYSLRVRPYHNSDNRIDGVVVMLVDIDALKTTQAYTESIIATVREPLLVLDKNLNVQSASRSFYDNFNMLAEETDGLPLFELGSRRWYSPQLQYLLSKVLPEKSEVNDFAMSIETPERGKRNLLLNARRLIQTDDRPPLILLALEDITDRETARKAMDESDRRLRFVIDTMPQKILTATSNGMVDYVNPQWQEYTGITFEQIKGVGWKMAIHPEDAAATERVWQRAMARGEICQFEHRLRRADGEYRWHLSRVLPLRDAAGNVVMWIGSNTDIDEQRQTANKLRQFAAAMSEADHRKNEFLAMLAHELRNPLAPIRNAVQILKLTGGDGKAVATASAMMERQVAQMVRLVDDLLDVSRISLGKIELRRVRVEFAAVVQQAIEAARPQIESLQQDLTVALPSNPVALFADPIRLTQIVGNLLNNASKFTERGGHIWLQVEEAGGDAILRVRDTGIGIAPEQLPRIFELFVQVDTSLGRSVSGLGIGLTLVKNLVEMHDGTIEVSSEGVSRGSEFLVRLPLLREEQMPAPKAPAVASAAQANLRTLVVDDNRDAAASLAMLLSLSGHETQMAFDGLEALEQAERFRPDLLLLDIGLPKLNGFEVATKIREAAWGQNIVLVALTGWGQAEDRQKTFEAGFNAHLVKPVDYGQLCKVISELLPSAAVLKPAS